MTDVFDVLADPTRRGILTLLRSSGATPVERSVGELVEALGITQPTVSKHLKALRDAGLVTVREEGQHRFYRFDDEALAEVRAFVGGTAHTRDAEPFVDLGEAGRAVGSLAHDVMTWVDSLLSRRN